MKLLNRDDFMKLPAGVMYSKGRPYHFDGFSVKGDTIKDSNGVNNDWFYLQLEWIDSFSCTSAQDAFDFMLEYKTSEPMESTYSRDGMHDYDDLFLVLDKDDLVKLKEYVNYAIKVTP